MLLGIFGDMGSGKTLYATRYVIREYVYRKKYDRCFANFHITSPDPSRPVELLTKDAFKSLSGMNRVLVVMDEAYLWLDSRRSTSKANVEVSYVVLQSRKRGFDILYIGQVKSSIDLRLRELSEIWVFAEAQRNAKGEIVNFHYLEVLRSSLEPRIRARDLSIAAARKYFPMFDTREIVAFA